MKSLILAAGYATRLYPLTFNKPKPLLVVGRRPAIEYIIERIEEIEEVEEILVVTNAKFFQQFEDWRKKFSSKLPLTILNDGTASEKSKLGAIGDMDFVIKKKKIADDLLVIGGDNLFDLGLREFVGFAKHKAPASSVGLHKLKNRQAVKKYSQVTLDSNDRIIEFIEKPKKPTSSLVAKCIYLFSQSGLGLISKYITSGNSTDAPGNYISWLCQKVSVYGFTFCGKWYDIGNYETYKKADREFSSL